MAPCPMVRTFECIGANAQRSAHVPRIGEGVAWQEDYLERFLKWEDSQFRVIKSFTASLVSVMRRSDMATLMLPEPEDEQETEYGIEGLEVQGIR